MTTDGPIRVGTRASALARTQTGWVVDRLREASAAGHPGFVIETIATQGDARADVPVSRIGGDGVFVRELERALLDGRIDAAVHSLKDMPTAETPGLVLASVPRRATPFDVLVGRLQPTLESLPPGAVVGTSSIRRVVQVRALRPDLEIRDIRGNVDTRLRRLDAGDYDALVLAGAGLERLGLAHRITQILRPDAFWPAVAQGALAVQCRVDDRATRGVLEAVDDPATHLAVRAERACLAALAGGCLAPAGGGGPARTRCLRARGQRRPSPPHRMFQGVRCPRRHRRPRGPGAVRGRAARGPWGRGNAHHSPAGRSVKGGHHLHG
ncbi:MAG: hydroxymethylbilane synthase [Planctomycetia bacterium]|nr:hydroxymethylbilane synthase [Planctomycetia bacterium]